MKTFWGETTLLAAFCCFVAALTAGEVDQQRARAYFEEAAELCQAEGGRLWGVSLCGPMVFADAQTRTIATNQPAPDAPRPRLLGYANAAAEWGGQRWSTFVWAIIPAQDSTARARLFMHELFHRVQPGLGLYISKLPGEAAHLDVLEGRVWMQLEWRALAAALAAPEGQREQAVKDALAFRMARRERFPGADEIERISEINEGLAHYTGTVAATPQPDRAAEHAVQQLREWPDNHESFVRTFAYPSGAAYGILLDLYSPGWTRRIDSGDDLGKLLMEAAGLEPSSDAEEAARRYGGPRLRAAELERKQRHEALVAEYKRRFVDGPVLVLPRGRNASFITKGVTPIPGHGTIYPSFKVSGEWGSVEADYILVSPDGGTLALPAPDQLEGFRLEAEGWTVTLNPGWTVRSGRREGDFEVVPGQ